MVSGRLFPSVILSIVLAGCGSPDPVAPRPAAPAPFEVDDLRASVFEVVIPELEPPNITYVEPLPVHLLPKHEREDPYFSIGTAFTMDGTTFVSAAHVFTLEYATHYGARRLRGTDGTVYEIDRFLRYSGVRDLVVFTLRDPPKVAKPLVRGATPEVGATVQTVGNAQGEGLSVRGGNVSSFTPEPLDGAWKFIRYSAPTSPGNSGGPLLDAQGRVVGIIVRKNEAENLNFAVPVEELDRLSTTQAEFHGRYSEVESGERAMEDRRFEVPLPADYATLATQAQAGDHAATVAQRAAFEAKHHDRIFPTSPKLRELLRAQAKSYYPAELVRDARGEWSSGDTTRTGTFEVGVDQNLYVGKSGDYIFVVLERPADVPLATFLAEPERVMDAMVAQLPFKRPYAGESIRVTSFGAPAEREVWRDVFGRPWISVTWTGWGDQNTTLHCTTYPRGQACIVADGSARFASTRQMYARINAQRWTLSYDGEVKDWIEYMAVDPALRPDFLSGAVTLEGTTLAARLGGFDVAVTDAGLAADTFLFAEVEYASVTTPAMRVSAVAITTVAETGALSYRAERVYEPLLAAHREWWEDVTGAVKPYDSKVNRESDNVEILNVDPTPAVALPPDTAVEARVITSCWTYDPKNVTDKALVKACGAFRKRVKVLPE